MSCLTLCAVYLHLIIELFFFLDPFSTLRSNRSGKVAWFSFNLNACDLCEGTEWGYLGRAVWLERWSEPVFPLCKRRRVWILSELCRSLLFSVHLQESSWSPEPSVHLLVQLRRQKKELIRLTNDTWAANICIAISYLGNAFVQSAESAFPIWAGHWNSLKHVFFRGFVSCMY